MTGALVLRADAGRLPLPDESVDLIVTSPPYFGQRSYKDGGEHYDGQIGSEPTPQEFLAALWSCTSDWWRVLKPTGSAFVNLGDKRSGSGAPGTTTGLGSGNTIQGARSQYNATNGAAQYPKAAFGRAKSKQLLPQRYAIGCEDGAADPDQIGWIVREELIWHKANGMPESVRDRCRDTHEPFWHLTKNGEYYAAIDELREQYDGDRALSRRIKHDGDGARDQRVAWDEPNPLGRLPDDVWRIATEPLKVPAWLGIDHFAAFPSEWPRRLILGWSPPTICLECGEGRRPVVETSQEPYREAGSTGRPKTQDVHGDRAGNGWNGVGYPQTSSSSTITGYACACTPYTDHPERRIASETPRSDRSPKGRGAIGRQHAWPAREAVREYHLEGWTPPAGRPAVVLDPFGGTGTTAMVARALGRIGISVDLSADYSRLAKWRIFDSGHGAKAVARTNAERQQSLL